MTSFSKYLVYAVLGAVSCMSLRAQEHAVQDTLSPAVKTDSRRIEMTIGNIKTDIEGIKAVISPMGEAIRSAGRRECQE
jgi:hypothetical protein